jgi:hypothetical protein
MDLRDLGADIQLDDQDDGSDESADESQVSAPKKSKKKKPKKKKKPAALAVDAAPAEEADEASAEPVAREADAPLPQRSSKKAAKGKKKDKKEDDGLDEIDRALAELGMKNGGAGNDEAAESGAGAGNTAGGKGMAGGAILGFRQMLSVDPKNLDADAELKRFFGSKVVSLAAPLYTPASPAPRRIELMPQISSSSSGSRSHRPGPSSKLRYTISKPKPNYPPTTSLAGLGMREMTSDEADEVHGVGTAPGSRRSARLAEWRDPGEKWFTFEHAGQWREVVRQFLGAVQSHGTYLMRKLGREWISNV